MPASIQSDARRLDRLSFEDKIRRRAHQIFLQRGQAPGSALGDWLQAEKELVREREEAIDEASEESFPASDPPAH